jgi:predicted enzyme related to lactoylglutathione lyase
VTPDLEESVTFYRKVFKWEINLVEAKKHQVAIVYFQGRPIASRVGIQGAAL